MLNGEKTNQDTERCYANGISASEICSLYKLRFYRDEVKQEFNLLGMCSTMLVFYQSFLVVPLAIRNTAANFRTVLAWELI